jgi:hypothetical protein
VSDYKADVSAVHEQVSIFVRGSQERSNGRSSLPPVALSASSGTPASRCT